jgi:SAM-dependent methyltransferase
MTRYFATRFRHVTGLDVSEEMIRLGRDALGELDNVTLDVGTGTDLSLYESARFDFVFSYIVLQHIPDASITDNYLREAGRVLKPGGNLYVQVNTMRATLRERLGALRRRLLRTGGAAGSARPSAGPSGLDHPAWVGSRTSVARIRRVLESSGLQTVSITGAGTQYTWVRAVRSR